jgi:hypothetical protein
MNIDWLPNTSTHSTYKHRDLISYQIDEIDEIDEYR